MKGKDEIQNLFSDKLGGYEAKVNPDLWANVASQIGAGAATTATGMALTTKFIIGLGAASIIAVTALVVMNKDEDPVKQVAVVEQPVEKPEKVIIKEIPDIVQVEPDVSNVDPDITPVGSPVLIDPIPEPISTLVVVDPLIITPAERIRMEDNPLDNVFKADDQLEVVDTAVAEAIVLDPIVEVSEDIITEESTEIKIVFPNVFTPNNDGINDQLFISNTDDLNEESFYISILDASYKEVYSSNDPNFVWNGTDKGGNELKEGYYIALITCKDQGGKEAKPVMYPFEIKK